MESVSDAEMQESLQWWGYMLRPDNSPSAKLDRLLRGVASTISQSFGQTDNNDLSPIQMAAFYKSVGGDYDPLFLQMPHQSIAFIYKSLGCLHSLQPSGSDVHVSPSVPSLKTKGFVTWQTIQLLLGPEEHVPFLQNALRRFDVRDPDDGSVFPKLLPTACFPATPDPKMETWHKQVSEHLRLAAQQGTAPRPQPAAPRASTEISVDGSADERADAAHYFSNPFNRNREGKPGIIQTITNAPVKVFQGGKMVVGTMFQSGKMVADPRLFASGRRRSLPDRTASSDSGVGGHAEGSKTGSGGSKREPRRRSDRRRRTRSRSHSRSRSRSASSEASDVERVRSPRERARQRAHSYRERGSNTQTHGNSPPDAGRSYRRDLNRRDDSSSSRNRGGSGNKHTSRSPRRPNPDHGPSRSPPWAARVGGGAGHHGVPTPHPSQPGQNPQQQQQDYLTPDQGRRTSAAGVRSSSETRGAVYAYNDKQRQSAHGYGSIEERFRQSFGENGVGYHSETPRSRSDNRPVPTSQPYQSQSRSPTGNDAGYDGRTGAAPQRMGLDRHNSYTREQAGSGYRSGGTSTPVNGVKGRKYPNETPWQ